MTAPIRRFVLLLLVAGLCAGCGDDHATRPTPIVRAWQPYGGGVLEGTIDALATYQGDLVMGGLFGRAGGVTAWNIARWDDTEWHALGSGTDDEVTALVEYQGALIAGGVFRQAGDAPAPGIARWDGAAWSPLGSGLHGSPAIVSALVVFQGHLIVAGDFTRAGDTPANNLALWDGARWQAMAGGIDGRVDRLAVQGGRLYISYTADQSAAPQLISWDGLAWTDLGADLPQAILSMTEFDGQLVMGAYGDVLRKTDTWRSFGRPNGSITSLAVFAGQLVASGSFTTMNGAPARGVAEWDGTRWQPLGGGLCLPISRLIVFRGDLLAATAYDFRGSGGDCGASATDFRLIRWAPIRTAAP